MQNNTKPIRTLVLDEDRSVCQSIESIAVSAGHHVTTCFDVESALEAHMSDTFDIMIVNQMLPGMTGLQLCRHIRALPNGDAVVILIMTSCDKCENIDKAIQAGASDYIVKSTITRDLKMRITIAEHRLIEINKRRNAEYELRHNASHDSLTGLPNRTHMRDRIDQCIERARRNIDYVYGVLFIDLDNFKIINDSLGREAGDELLIGISQRLSACLRKLDVTTRPGSNTQNNSLDETMAHLGGDEFVVLLDGMADSDDAQIVAQRILTTLSEPFTIHEIKIVPSLSIGIATNAELYDNASDLLRDADIALAYAKLKGNGPYEVFSQDMRDAAIDRLQLENELRFAIERDELFLHYQPIISLDTGRIKGFEALVRWQHATRGLIPPLDFIPLAEDTGLIIPIGNWVLRTACQQVATWRREIESCRDLTISVNLSSKQFTGDDNLVSDVMAILDETNLESHALKLEITESVMIEDAEYARRVLDNLKNRGIGIHMDDFGTGYSSLAYLHNLPIDTIKLDQSFIRNMVDDDEHAVTVQAVMMLAKNLNMQVVAEGVETIEHINQLQKFDCNFAQGYYFSRPVDCNAAAELLENNRIWGISQQSQSAQFAATT